MFDLETGALTFGDGLQISPKSSFVELIQNPAFAKALSDKPMNPEYPYFSFATQKFYDRVFHVQIFFHQDRHHSTQMYWMESNTIKKGWHCDREDNYADRRNLKAWLEKKLGVPINHHDVPSDLYTRSWGCFGPFMNIRFAEECYLTLRYNSELSKQ